MKKLLFPITILIFFIVTFWVIKPIWFSSNDGIFNLLKDISKNDEKFKVILGKESNIEELNKIVTKNKNKEGFMQKYFPDSNKNENIINDINRMATASQVGVESLEFEEPKKSNVMKNADSQISKMLLAKNSNQKIDVFKESREKTISTQKPSVILANISILGEYNNIKMFLGRLYSAPLINNVLDIEINKEISGNTNAENNGGISLLSLKAKVAFGYMEKNSIDIIGNLSDPIFTKKDIDFSGVEQAESIVINNGSIKIENTGKNNPFEF